ncbi:glycerophosphodiester phosphodiesterase family protein [Palleronia sp. LCG004]|uniref:glycerophosphodiester phosphodiesterase family protein n=1 Tax=Palleronia sp. LCG004 TaxID=3079304 RepID=UPI002943619E|nr:glycerophosphodiester phosphodiesterase family protein [Palleronia sp. LCG004]WOI54980.1 glycerophosphodiester phosphodiesterase family protein [Palleronia sp. LCG004]
MLRLSALAAAATVAAATPILAATFDTLSGEAPIVIAHRGASGYLPEHTLGAYELAIRMGADIVEPDLQETSDGHVVAMHDATLTRTTNVEELFERRNGEYRVKDFTLEEIRTLTVEPTRTAATEYPGFTPSMDEPFRVPTWNEVIEFVASHNATTGTRIGLYPEAKAPSTDNLNRQIVDGLKAAGFDAPEDNTFIQTFSHDTAAEIARLQDLAQIDNAIAALGAAVLSEDGVYGVSDYTTGTFNSLSYLASFADGVGVSLGSSNLEAGFITAAHDLGLQVHGWTFRPTTIDEARAQFTPYIEMGMDGLFTDYADLGRQVVDEYAISVVPLPAGLPLLLAGIGGLAVLRRARRT